MDETLLRFFLAQRARVRERLTALERRQRERADTAVVLTTRTAQGTRQFDDVQMPADYSKDRL